MRTTLRVWPAANWLGGAAGLGGVAGGCPQLHAPWQLSPLAGGVGLAR
jgi:hypothetical protein